MRTLAVSCSCVGGEILVEVKQVFHWKMTGRLDTELKFNASGAEFGGA